MSISPTQQTKGIEATRESARKTEIKQQSNQADQNREQRKQELQQVYVNQQGQKTGNIVNTTA